VTPHQGGGCPRPRNQKCAKFTET